MYGLSAYLGESVHHLLLAFDIGVEKTQDELEIRLFPGDQRHLDV